MKRYKRFFTESSYKFNTRTTGMSMYDDLLENPDKKDYFKYYKGMIYHIDKMSPEEFINQSLNGKKVDVYSKIDRSNVDKYADKISKGAKFDMPVLDYDEDGFVSHEGRHRVIAMERLGMKEIDVMIVTRIKPDKEKWFDLVGNKK